jgi:hypothetical protein
MPRTLYEKRVSVLASAVPVVNKYLLDRLGIFTMRHLGGGLLDEWGCLNDDPLEDENDALRAYG